MDDVEALHALSPPEFEQLVARYLARLGYTDMWVVGDADGLGFDVRGRDAFGRIVAARCQRYPPGATVGPPEIRRFVGVVADADAADGIFVTTASFAAPAVALARERGIALVPGDRMAAFLRAPGPKLRRRAELRRRRDEEGRQEADLNAEAEVVAEATTDEGEAERRQEAPRPPAESRREEEAQDPEPRRPEPLVGYVGPDRRARDWGAGLLWVFILLPFALILVAIATANDR